MSGICAPFHLEIWSWKPLRPTAYSCKYESWMCSLTDMISTAYYIICSSSSSKFDEFHCFHQLHLQEGGLHADINGDGVLDHVQVCNCFFHLRQSKPYECIFYCLLDYDICSKYALSEIHIIWYALNLLLFVECFVSVPWKHFSIDPDDNNIVCCVVNWKWACKIPSSFVLFIILGPWPIWKLFLFNLFFCL